MRRPISKALIRDYLSARRRALRFIRDSSPPLTKKGLALRLKLEASAFNKFVNGTIFTDAEGGTLSVTQLDDQEAIYLREKWTEKRLGRFVSQVETECWTLGITHKPNPIIRSAARNEIEQLRLSKFFQYLGDIKDSANLSVASAVTFWNVCAQEAQDAREHLRPTMCVNALCALGDIVDRRADGQLCSLDLVRNGQRESLDLTASAVELLIREVHQLSGSPCEQPPTTKLYECFHKAHGYGGYDKYFLGLALESPALQETGIKHMLWAVHADHHRNDGHVANTATVIESAFRRQDPRARDWATYLQQQIERRLSGEADASVCVRLVDMSIPHLREHFGEETFRRLEKVTGRRKASQPAATQPAATQSAASPVAATAPPVKVTHEST